MNHQMIVYHRIFLDIEQIFVEEFGLFQPSNFLFNFDSFIILLCCLLLIVILCFLHTVLASYWSILTFSSLISFSNSLILLSYCNFSFDKLMISLVYFSISQSNERHTCLLINSCAVSTDRGSSGFSFLFTHSITFVVVAATSFYTLL